LYHNQAVEKITGIFVDYFYPGRKSFPAGEKIYPGGSTKVIERIRAYRDNMSFRIEMAEGKTGSFQVDF